MSNRFSLFKAVVFVFISCMIIPTLPAQEPDKLTLETMRDPSLNRAVSIPRTWWLRDNTVLLYDMRKPAEERALERLIPSTGKRTVACDMKKAEANFAALFIDEKAPSFPSLPSAFTDDGTKGLYVINGDIFVIELGSARVIRVTTTPETETSVNFSPDGKKLAYVRNKDLYVYSVGTGIETRLTKDGSDTILNGTLSWVYWEEIFGRRDIGYWWSDDSKAVAFLQTDESGVSIQHYVDITPWTPTVTTQRYPKVGEQNPKVRVGIVEIAAGAIRWVDLSQGEHYEYVIRVDWVPDNKQLCLRTLNRLQTELSFWLVDRSTGKSRFVMKDTNEGWINNSDDLYFTGNGKQFIISSERDGYAHLYRFTMDGKLVNQITEGPWALSSSAQVYWVRKAIAGIDEKNSWIYFTALEKTSVEKHLYRINFDGLGIKRLSTGDGAHVVSMSPDAKYYIDRFSSIDTPPSLTLRNAYGKELSVLAQPDLAGFKKFGAQFGEIIWIPARDGFKLPAWILKPKNLEPGKKYAVVVSVYGGPSAPTVSNSFSGSRWENVLLNEGYLSFKVDNRAATAISKTLENLLLKNTPSDIELNDLIDGIHWLKAQPYVDSDRIGITGWSGGGTNTIMAMTRSTEFKAGIAGAGVTDGRFYDTKWEEAAMKTEKENLEGFEKASLLKDAKNLHGRLMLVHGGHDDNVHIQNTWRFVNELINANKVFELMVYPLRKHGVGDPAGSRHLNATTLDFWKRNL